MHQMGDEQEQPCDPRRELARRQREATYVGDGLGAGPGLNGTLVVEPAWQRSEPLRGEHLAYRGGTQRHSLVRERLSVITLSDVLLVGLFDGLPTSASRTL